MVVADLVLILQEQDAPVVYSEESIQVECYDRNKTLDVMYKDGFSKLQCIQGIWYYVYPCEEKIYIDPFFDLDVNAKEFHVLLREKWSEIVISIIDFYLDVSPEQCIYILIRLDYPAQEVFHDKVTRDEYVELLHTGQICFDEVYVVSR